MITHCTPPANFWWFDYEWGSDVKDLSNGKSFKNCFQDVETISAMA